VAASAVIMGKRRASRQLRSPNCRDHLSAGGQRRRGLGSHRAQGPGISSPTGGLKTSWTGDDEAEITTGASPGSGRRPHAPCSRATRACHVTYSRVRRRPVAVGEETQQPRLPGDGRIGDDGGSP